MELEEIKKNLKAKLDNYSIKKITKNQKIFIEKLIDLANDEKLANDIYDFCTSRTGQYLTLDVSLEQPTGEIALLDHSDWMNGLIKSKENSNSNRDFNNEHKLIIGENYDALQNLLITHKNKIDVIYIDPPYNTEKTREDGNFADEIYISENEKRVLEGKSSFVYNDRFIRKDWLNMMNNRLRIAKQLLKEDGIIFISIDDSEQAYLKVLMDQIFGEENFIANIVWQKKNSGSGSDSKYLKNLTEYILFYSKNEKIININKKKIDINDGSYKFKDKYYETRGLYKEKQLDGQSLTWSESLDDELLIDGKYYYAGGVTKEEWLLRKQNHALKDWRWRWSKNKILWGLENGYVFARNNKLYTKQYQLVNNNDELEERKIPFSNLILNNEISGSTGTDELKNIFNGNKLFDHPKPKELIKYLINLHPNKNAIILDFFAGSGTTGQAVMELNREDNGNRKFILCTNNENNIAYDTTSERLYRIINGVGSKGEIVEWSNKNDPYKNDVVSIYEIKDFNIDWTKNNKNTLSIEDLGNHAKSIFQEFSHELSNINVYNYLSSLKKTKKIIDDEE